MHIFAPNCRTVIDMDAIKNFHSQQDYPGCVDGEANIMKKCDARRQVVSDNDMFSSLSKEWDRLMISVLTGMYEDLLIGGQVDVLTAVHEGLLNGEQTDVNNAEKRPSCAEGK